MSMERNAAPPGAPTLADLRRADILAAAVTVARTQGYLGINRRVVANRAGVAPSLVNHYFDTMDALRRAVMDAAVTQRLLPLIAQGLAHGDTVALGAPADVRAAAVASVGGDL